MKKNCILAGLILMVLFSTVLNSGFVKEIKAGNIAGIVECEGKPLADIQVSISGKKAKTDSNGKFFISDITPGAYIVAVTGEKCIKSFFKPVLAWSDSTIILILLSDTLPRPALNCKVKETMEIDRSSFDKMDLEYLMKLDLSSAKKEVVPDSARKIVINGDTVIEVRLGRYPEGPIELDSKQMKIAQEKNVGTGNIAGIVTDKSTGKPLAGATVYIEELRTIGAKTDTMGRFWLSSIPASKYTIRAGKTYYYSDMISEVKVAKDSTSIVLFRLVYTSIPERPWPSLWHGNKVKCDSIEFYNDYYKTLLRKR